MTEMYSPRGSLWHRWDLHFHTPASYDYENKGLSDVELVDALVSSGVRAVAITDHHIIDVSRILSLQTAAGADLTILPGIELRDNKGGKPIHYICMFPDDCDIDHVWITLQGRLGLTAVDISTKGGDDSIYVPLESAAPVIRELGGVVSIHAGAKSNSIEGIRNTEQFQQRIKYDITRQYVDILEIGQIKDIARYYDRVFPVTNIEKPLVICSDNHNASSYDVRAPLWIRADPTFRGLLMAIREPRDRVFIGAQPPDLARLESSTTKYIRSLAFTRRSSAPPGEVWFPPSVEFNPGLVAIIGNKGSGKSALADAIGFLGASRNADAFSFLNRERFRHPKAGLAEHFEATLTWESGEQQTRVLSSPQPVEAPELVKYLPQAHVETICNELLTLGEQGFERELKAVIFSHVPDPERLGHSTFDALIRFHTDEKQKRIDSLQRQLRDLNRRRAVFAEQVAPASRQRLVERIKRQEHELAVHTSNKPTAVPDPAEGRQSGTPDPQVLSQLESAISERKNLSDLASVLRERIRGNELRLAIASRLLESLQNYQKDHEAFIDALQEDAQELALDPRDLVSLTMNHVGPIQIQKEATTEVAAARRQLDSESPPGVIQRVAALDGRISDLRAQLDAPTRMYQAYLASLSTWESARQELQGNTSAPESLAGLEARLAELDRLPQAIEELRSKQVDIALQIHAAKMAQVEAYRSLYGPVQHFMDSHVLAREKLKLEFRAELTHDLFTDQLFSMLALNRRGSFMGIEEGKARAEQLLEAVVWDDASSVRRFLAVVDEALHKDQRPGQGASVQLPDQLAKGKRPEDMFAWLYGLDYVRPRYALRWAGKELAMLSPGERGTLLLAFYLLIEKGDMPIVIDQPEGNLDNFTVAKVLVECIKEAKRRRQVFVVTHNPNLAVVCDADQVVHACMEKEGGNAIAYTTGSLENPSMSQFLTDVLEGTRWAFDKRAEKYKVTD